MPHFIHFPWSWDMLSVGLKVKHYFNSVSHIQRESERVKYNRFYTFIHTRTFEHLPVEWLWWTGWMGKGCVHKSKEISWMYVVSVCVCLHACECGCWMDADKKLVFYRHGIVVLTIFPAFTLFGWKMSQVMCIVLGENNNKTTIIIATNDTKTHTYTHITDITALLCLMQRHIQPTHVGP